MYFPKDASIDFQRALRKTQNYFEGMIEYIPEFIDLRKIIQQPDISDEEFKDAFRKMNSYIVHIALWNGEEIETIHLFEYYLLFQELFDISKIDEVREELKKIINSFS